MVMQSGLRFWTLTMIVTLAGAACSNPVSGNGHRTMRDALITAENGDTLAYTQNNLTWVGAPLVLQQGEPLNVRIYFVAPDGTHFQLPTSGASHTLHVSSDDPSIARYEAVSASQGRFVSDSAGDTNVKVYLWHGVHPDGHEDGASQPLAVTVQ